MIKLALHHLAVIRSLGNTGNVSATARELGVTQSAISHRMKEAERRIGVALFYRDGHSISLNQAGRRLLKSADTILSEVALAERDLERLSSGYKDTVRMGAACYAGFDWYPALLEEIKKQYPAVSLEMVSEITEDPSSLLSRNIADIVLAASKIERPDIQCIPLVEDQLVAVLPKDHELGGESYVDPMVFQDVVYATHHTFPESGREYDTIFKPLGIMPKRVISAGRSQAVLELVLSGKAITILPSQSVKSSAKRLGLVLKPVTKAGISITWYGLVRKTATEDDLPFAIAQLLKDCLLGPV